MGRLYAERIRHVKGALLVARAFDRAPRRNEHLSDRRSANYGEPGKSALYTSGRTL
jgi:hypothetical protein